VSNVVARSSYVNTIDLDLCIECELCLDECPFEAISSATSIQIDPERCVGCGVCVQHCTEDALKLVLRETVQTPPETIKEWGQLRAQARGIDMQEIL
jgi:ferredoxin